MMTHRPPQLTRIAAALAAIGFCAASLAAPSGANVVAGSASVRTAGNQTDVVQTTPRAVIDWRSFDIGANESVHFRQPDAQSMALNRVTGGQASQILGTLTANGQIILLNPNGVLFGRDARVETAGLVVSTAKLATDDFMQGRLRFEAGDVPGASIVNRGTISVRDGGLAAFVAPHVRNDGLIYAKLGRVILASGSRFTLDLAGDGLLDLGLRESDLTGLRDVEGKPVGALIENTGTIATPSGRTLIVTPEIARNLVDNAINLGGTVRADTIEHGPAGEIMLYARNGNVNLTGEIAAPSRGNGPAGTFRLREDRDYMAIDGATAGSLGAILRTGTNVALESSGRISVDPAPIDGRGGLAGGSLSLAGSSIGLGNDLITNDGAIRLDALAGNIEVSRASAALAGDRFWPMLFAGSGNIGLSAARDVTVAHMVTRGDVEVESLGGNVRLLASLGTDLDGTFALRSLTVRALATPDSRDAGNVSEFYDVTVAAGGKIDIHATRNIQLFATVAGRTGLALARAGTEGRDLRLNSDRLGLGNLAFNSFYWSTSSAASRARHNGPGTNAARGDGRWADLSRTTKETGSPTLGAPPGPTQALPSIDNRIITADSGILVPPPAVMIPDPLPDVLPGATPDSPRFAPAGRLALAAVPFAAGESTAEDEEGYSANRGIAQFADIGRAPAVAPPKDVFSVTEHVVELTQCNTPAPAAMAYTTNAYFHLSAFGQPLATGCR